MSLNNMNSFVSNHAQSSVDLHFLALDPAGSVIAVTVTVTLWQKHCSLPCKPEIQWVAILAPLKEITVAASALSVHVL